MRIESVYIKNFRCFKEDTIYFDNYTCLIGANGAGKSTVFSALHVFFRHFKDSKTDLSKLNAQDFHHGNTKDPIIIQVTFSDLSEQATQDLKDYVRQGKLTVTAEATYDSVNQKAEVKQYGNRLGFSQFREYFEMEKAGKKVSELATIYAKLKDTYTELPVTKTKDLMESALKDFEAKHPQDCILIASEDQFYGATRGISKLSPHVQWVFVPASKDVTEEGEESKNSALGQLLSRTVRAKVNFTEKIGSIRENANKAYADLLYEEQNVLDSLSDSLKGRLTQWAHPSINAAVKWKHDPDKSVKIEEPVAGIEIGERGFEGELSRFGHGLQRSFMLALLQEMNSSKDEGGPTLILSIEEPELYQHPPQARYLSETLQDLAKGDTQVMVCSHSPVFVPKANFENVRIVRELGNPVETKNSQITYEEISHYLISIGSKPISKAGIVAKLFPYLSPSINEMFFSKIPIFVEGIEDVAYIKTYLEFSGQSDNYRKAGCDLINADKKSNIIIPLAVSKLLKFESFVVFDLDTDTAKDEQIKQHQNDNKKLLSIQGYETESEWPSNNIIKSNLWGWKTNIGNQVKAEIPNWSSHFTTASLEYGDAGTLQKNPLAISRTLELAWLANEKSPTLLSLINKIITFAQSKHL